MKPDRTASTRQSRARQALAQSGGRTVTVKLGPDAAAVLAGLRSTGLTVRDAIELALFALTQSR